MEDEDILVEEREGDVLYYIRDDGGELVGVMRNGEIYYYQKNYQGDIEGIYDSSYKLIVKYRYDAYGNVLSIEDNEGKEITDNNHIGRVNPYRYRSYYYDEETNLYYLKSRYYNPLWGRFINADGIIGTNNESFANNLFVYGNNNPVSFIDTDGNMPELMKLTVKFGLKLFVSTRKVLKNSTKLLVNALIGKGNHVSYGNNSSVAKMAKKSTQMKKEIQRNLEDYKTSGKKTKKYSKAISLYDSSSLNDLDVSLSIGSLEEPYNMKISTVYDIVGNGTVNEIHKRYKIEVTLYDSYDFNDPNRPWNSLKGALNNIGYYAQQAGLLTPYKWDVNYIVYIDGGVMN